MTSFITVHVDGVPVLININEIACVCDNEISMIHADMVFEADESFADINNKIAEEISQ